MVSEIKVANKKQVLIMAIVPGKSIAQFATLKPYTFALWCLLCDVKSEGLADVYIDAEKAHKIGIGKSAYFHALAELEEKNWIEFSRKADGKKWWKLIKGFTENSTNVEFQPENKPTNVEYSANVESEPEEIPQTWTENSTNVDSHIRNNLPLENNTLKQEKDLSNDKSKKKTHIFKSFPIPRPDVETELWNEYLQSRAKLNKPLTDRAYTLLLSDLAKLPNFDLNRRLVEAVDKKWQGLIFKDDLINGVANVKSSTSRTETRNGNYGTGSNRAIKPPNGNGETSSGFLAGIGANPKR